jgi:hypothetical protein
MDVAFELNGAGPASGFQQTGQIAQRFSRVPAPVTTAAALGEAAGRYYSPELGVTWTVAVKDSMLVATVVNGRQVTWQPAFKDGFTGDGSTIELTRDGRGRVVALLVTPGRSRNIRFDRAR